MKRYLLFVYEEGYDSYNSPKGWSCFEGDFDDAQAAAAEGKRQCGNSEMYSWEVVDTTVKAIVLSGSGEEKKDMRPPPTEAELAAHPEMRPQNVAL